uniref:CCHC-type domain-containing protein n=1 Tax=Neogobius melanostomus TaxID=47308 RepID=A0A8C6WNJ3_9GOBI
AGRGQDQGCFNCGGLDHWSRDCNQGGQQEGCFHCGGLDHWSRDCTRGGQQAACFNCGDPSHWSRDCPNPPARVPMGEHAGHRGSDIQQGDLAVLDQPRGIVEVDIGIAKDETVAEEEILSRSHGRELTDHEGAA